MIAKMSKVEIVGPKALLEDVLSLLQKNGVFQIEPEKRGFVEKVDEDYINSLIPEEKTFRERIFLENLKSMIDQLNSYLPPITARESYLNPSSIIDTIAENLKKHLLQTGELNVKKEALEKELQQLRALKVILDTALSMVEGEGDKNKLDFAGFVLKSAESVEELEFFLRSIVRKDVKVQSAVLPDGQVMAVVALERSSLAVIKALIKEKDMTDYTMPSYLENLSLQEKINVVSDKINQCNLELNNILQQLAKFASRWSPIYNQTRLWIEERLSVINAMASVFETKMCFFIYGWIPSAELKKIEREINTNFRGKVIVQEKEIREEDLEKVPVILKNPAYFRPFELLIRFLPLPKYTTYDPTPFIGIFFPLFFGMILGDIGYALVLATVSLFLITKFKDNQNISDAGRILLFCSFYSAIFGVLYGEFFGDLPKTLFGLEPLWVERREAILPVLYFAMSVGIVHIVVGLFLGVLSAYKRGTRKEMVFRLLNIALIFSALLIVTSLAGILPFIITKPVIVAVVIIVPFLLFSGGLLAPLEVIKSIGNIISYARIMAIGLTSVLIAYVANKMAGMIGNVVAGVFVAVFLHLINIILGLFSPTVHSLRLHYVEFFSKFVEQGGRRYTPLKR